MTELFPPFIAGLCLTLLLLALEHFLLWDVKLKLTTRYALGTAAIGAGLTLAAGLAGEWFTPAAFWLLAVAGGLEVEALHRWRERRGEHPRDIDDAFEAGRIVGPDEHGAP